EGIGQPGRVGESDAVVVAVGDRHVLNVRSAGGDGELHVAGAGREVDAGPRTGGEVAERGVGEAARGCERGEREVLDGRPAAVHVDAVGGGGVVAGGTGLHVVVPDVDRRELVEAAPVGHGGERAGGDRGAADRIAGRRDGSLQRTERRSGAAEDDPRRRGRGRAHRRERGAG